MGRKNRKFIDKKQDVVHSFKVVQRSQKDPLTADESAPQGVLIDTGCSETHEEELHKYGVYFDDEYDYLQHLRGVKEAIDWENCDAEVYTIRNEDTKRKKGRQNDVGLTLPSSAFESYVEEPIGLLNRAAPITGPRPELDPDIVAELDREEGEEDLFSDEEEDELPDDFVTLLNSEEGPPVEEEGEEEFDNITSWLGNMRTTSDSYGSDRIHRDEITPSNFPKNDIYLEENSCDSDVSSNFENESDENDFGVSEDEDERERGDRLTALPTSSVKKMRRSRTDALSHTSASSSTVPRTELQRRLDERFEYMFEREYNEDQIGALDGEVIEGTCSFESEVIRQAMQTYHKKKEEEKMENLEGDEKDKTKDWIRNCYNEREELVWMDIVEKPNYGNVESYASTLSTTRNLPRVLEDPCKNRRPKKLTMRALRDHNKDNPVEEQAKDDVETATILSCISALSFRPKGETAEERRDRKIALRELRRERRKEKKVNQTAFKEQKKLMKKMGAFKPKPRIIPAL